MERGNIIAVAAVSIGVLVVGAQRLLYSSSVRRVEVERAHRLVAEQSASKSLWPLRLRWYGLGLVTGLSASLWLSTIAARSRALRNSK